MIKDEYRTVAGESEGLYREKGSKFIACLYPVENEAEIGMRLSEVRKKYPKARHYCYAWRLGLGENHYRINDDGEPSGTAGIPIFSQIRSAELTYILLIVVRYFGGTKLGASGLISAYKAAAREAITESRIITKFVHKGFKIHTSYQRYPMVMEYLKKFDVQIRNTDFTDTSACLDIQIRVSMIEQTFVRILAAILGRNEDEIGDYKKYPDLMKIEESNTE